MLPGGIPKGGPQAPSWSFQIGRVQGGEENEIFPSLVSFSLPLSFGQKRKRVHLALKTDLTLGKDEARSCWAVFVCILFFSREIEKEHQGIRQCLHWLMKLPPAASDMIRICPARKKADTRMGICFFGAAGQIRTADLILTKDALYLLSYSSKVHAPYWGHVWRPRRDLNPRPPA